MGKFYVYLLSNQHHTVFYVGFTNDVERRMREHKTGFRKSFTKMYNVNKLLYYEEWASAEEAMHRERQMKKYRRVWKENLINEMNPEWRDLWEDFGRFDRYGD